MIPNNTSADSSQVADVARTSIEASSMASAARKFSVKEDTSPGIDSLHTGPWASSGMPPTRLATKGVPQASDSRSTFGIPSEWLDNTVRSAARYQSGSWLCGTDPTNDTVPDSPSNRL